MSKDNVSDTFDREVEDSSKKYNENQKTLGTVYVSKYLANIIKDLVKLDLSAHDNLNMPGMCLNNENILEKIERTALHEPNKQRESNKNMKYLAELESLERRPGAKKIIKRRQKLPIYESIDEILEKMNRNQVIVVHGESGCGKTTQVPQYILDKAIKSREGSMCTIVCALPTRMNAIRAAKQVAEERGVTIGHDSPVGYHIGNDNESARANASITYCTSGVILRRMLEDPFLDEITHVILDEVQERDMITDFLLRLIKSLIVRRPSLKIIILCTTMYYKQFVTYFDNCDKVKVSAFLYPVAEFYLEDILMRINFTFSPGENKETLTRNYSDHLLSPKSETYPKHVQQALNDPNSEKLNLELIVAVITDINHYERDGAILVFLPGIGDISALQRMLGESISDLIIPIHGATVHDFQMFRTQHDKIYLATNVAESALNLDDVAYVIDTGRVKTRLYDDDNTDSLKSEWISLKNVEQRRRKAGRSGPGRCYHLFKKSVIADMKPYPVPEIIRRNLEQVILRMKVDGLGNAMDFFTKCISPIPEEDIQKSVGKLQAIKILNQNENLSALGQTLVTVSMDPAKGKMICLGAIFSCLEPIVTIAAQLIRSPILMESPIRAKQCTSDHIAFYQIIKEYEETDDLEKPEFCYSHHVNKYQIEKVQETKIELANKLRAIHKNINYKSCRFNVNSKNMNIVRAIVSAGLYPSIAIIRNHNSSKRKDITVITPEDSPRRFHNYSVNAKRANYPSSLLVYNGIFYRDNIRYLCESTLVSSLSLVLFCGKLSMSHDNEEFFLNLSENLRFRCDKEQTAKVLLGLREKLDFIIENEILNIYEIDWCRNTPIIRILTTVIDLLDTEYLGDRFPYVFRM